MRSSYYYWTGVDRRGHVHRGYVRGTTSVEVQAALAVRGVAMLSCAWSWRSLFSLRWWQMQWYQRRAAAGLSRALQAQWCRGMASLVAAGMSMPRAVQVTALQEKQQGGREAHMRAERLQHIARQLRAGKRLSVALQTQDGWFSAPVMSAIAAAQGTAAFSAVLCELATMLEAHDAQQRQLYRALTVPLLTLSAAMVVSMVALSVLVPTMVSVLGAGSELPPSTRQLIACIEWLRMYGISVTAFLIGGGVLAWQWAGRYEHARYWRDRMLYYMPISGILLQQVQSAQWLRRVSVQLRAGVSLIAALESVQQQVTNRYARAWQQQLCSAVRSGVPLAAACARVPRRCMPVMVTSLIGLAPHNEALASIADQAASLLSERMQHTTQLLLRLVQPAALGIVGVVVFGVIRALYAPLLQGLSSLTL